MTAETIRSGLEYFGHEADMSIGSAALEQFRLAAYDAVITELRLGSLRGTDLVIELRSILHGTPSPRWIGLTGSLPSALSTEALEAGFDSILLKPVSINQLHAAVMGIRSVPSLLGPWT